VAHLSIIVPHSTGFPVVIPRFVGIPVPRIRTSFIALAIPILVAQSLAPRSRCSLLARWSSFSVLVARAFTSVPGPRIGCHWPRVLFLICWNPFPVIPLARSPFIGLGFLVPAPLVGLPSLCIPTSSSSWSPHSSSPVLVRPGIPHSWSSPRSSSRSSLMVAGPHSSFLLPVGLSPSSLAFRVLVC
jgi:hypothetical protein